jgi:tetratricopeptide (TPR) repeat protein
MNANRTLSLGLAALVTAAFSLACAMQVAMPRSERDDEPFDLMQTLLGDSRRLFANHFFIKADAYFHSGFYPTIFDNRESFATPHMAADAGVVAENNTGDEHSFLGQPLDVFDRFSRNFFPAEHTHLDEGGASHDESSLEVREILPWLKLSASLDPRRVDTYTTTAFWLRSRLGKSREAEDFLRDGLRHNPRDPSILFELGRIFFQDRKEHDRARNVFEAALRYLPAPPPDAEQPDRFLELQLVSHLAELEEETGNLERSIRLWEHAKTITPNPAGPQKHIDDLRTKLSATGSP